MIRVRNHLERHTAALIINLMAPGAGLVLLRREWIGLVVALLVTIFSQIGLCGALFFPATAPSAVSVASGLAAVILWALAQWYGFMLAATAFGPAAQQRLRILCTGAEEAIDESRFADARDLLSVALSISDEDLEVHRQHAQLLTLTGRFREARRAWEHAIYLDQHRQTRAEAIRAMERLPG
ncbi:MAG: hypothetical protein JSU63_17515 [Phycisphaerales bacterium]|nr:MAG: hypothetical protein JSU63_17515 [Phycisphaerales bacterium]